MGRSHAHFSNSASELLVDHLIEIMAVLNLSNASSHLGFRSCMTLRRMHRDGQLDDYLRDGVDKRGIYLETDPDGLPSLQRHVQNHTRFNAASPLWRKLEPLSDEASGRWMN